MKPNSSNSVVAVAVVIVAIASAVVGSRGQTKWATRRFTARVAIYFAVAQSRPLSR